jgi:glycosyltransferase involved in cell wall biosynthesis
MLNAPGFTYTPWVAWEQAMLYKQYDALAAGQFEPSFRQFYTGNASVPRQLLLDAGLFDTTFRRAEDVELAYRMAERGAVFVFEPDAKAHHRADRSFASWLAMAEAYGRNDITFARDHQQRWVADVMVDEFRERNRMTQLLVRASLANRALRGAAAWSLRGAAITAAKLRAQKVARGALSGLYALTYYRGVAAEMGSGRDLGRILAGRLRNPLAHNHALLTVSGVIAPDTRERIVRRERPRADYFEISHVLHADLLDHAEAREFGGVVARLLGRVAGSNVMLAWTCWRKSSGYRVVITDGEQIGLPYALFAKLSRHSRLPRHHMIVHTMSPWKKRIVARGLRLRSRIDSCIVYSSTQAAATRRALGGSVAIEQTPFMVDTLFFAPRPASVPGDAARPVICSAGLEFRDYDTLVAAVEGLDVDVVIAAASPWSKRASSVGDAALPANVTVCKLSLAELRDLYARSTIVVMPLVENDFQAGITTILEAMAMGKPIVCSATAGQADTLVDGVTGVYVPVGDAASLRGAIESLLADPQRRERLGAAARAWAVEHADIEVYAERLTEIARGS